MYPRLPGVLLASLLAVCVSSQAALARQSPAPEGELLADRPGFTEPTTVVGRGVWQIESGVSFESDGSGADRARTLAAPQVLLRLGLNDRTELRLGTDGVIGQRLGSAARQTGVADLTISAKVAIAHAEGIGFDLTLIPVVSLPTGSAGVSSDRVVPGVKFAWGRGLGHGFAVAGNLSTAAPGDAEGAYARHSMSVSLARDLAAGFAAFWEVYGFSALERGGAQAWTFDTGATHPLGRDAQVDVTVGRGLSAAAPDWFVSGGIVVRRFRGR